MKRLIVVWAALFTLLFAAQAQAASYRATNLTWRVPDPVGAPLTVEMAVTFSFQTGSGAPTTSVDFGDGFVSPATLGSSTGTAFDSTTATAYVSMRYTTTHTYAAAGVYTATLSHCCRDASLLNGANTTHLATVKVAVGAGDSAGPYIATGPVIDVPVLGTHVVSFPMGDADGDTTTCRFATTAESNLPAGQTVPTIPATGAQPVLTSSPGLCTLTWTMAGALSSQRHALAIVVESTHGGVTVSAAREALIESMSGPLPTCSPGGPHILSVGQTFTLPLTATLAGSPSTILPTPLGIPSGATLSPSNSGPSPYNTTFTWTPTTTNAGTVSLVNLGFLGGVPARTTFCSLTLEVQACPGFGSACTAGVGACQSSGTIVCSSPGVPTCSAVPGSPVAESCNNLDDDCDGAIDNGNPGSGQACSSGLPGACSAGTTSCVSGALACNATVLPGQLVETCDGSDEDCDGAVDNGNPGSGVACSTGLSGACNPGLTSCVGGAIACIGNVVPGQLSETCNSVDDDCDTFIDEGTGLGQSCQAGLGVCKANGSLVCDGFGGTLCNAVPGQPSPEVCGNGIDEDCDGTPDDGCGDTDNDGLIDLYEAQIGTSQTDQDTDDDGVIDGDEVQPDVDTDGDGAINALDPDSDDDGVFDGTELGLSCILPATDVSQGHCLTDIDPSTTTDPLNADTDGGTVPDGVEDANQNGRVDPGETDPNDPNDDIPECTMDGDCGDATSGKVCSAAGNCVDGCRGQGGNGCPDGQMCTSTDTTIGTCEDIIMPDCVVDADCDGPMSGVICENAMCIAGCRGEGGNGCPAGQVCSSTDATMGVCYPEHTDECTVDSDCGAEDSGRVCDETKSCADGCRGQGGNGCPSGKVCTSTTEAIGVCQADTVEPVVDDGAFAAAGSGVTCGFARDDKQPLWIAFPLLALMWGTRRMRRRERATSTNDLTRVS